MSAYIKELANTAVLKGQFTSDATYEEETLKQMSHLSGEAYKLVCTLEEQSVTAETICDAKEKADYYMNNVLVTMADLRERIDKLESMTSAKYWPYPSYGELLFGIK